MSMTAQLQPEPAPLTACTVSRDVQNFDLLIEDMETELGEAWGDLTFSDALAFFDQADAGSLEFVAVAIDSQDEANLTLISDVIGKAGSIGIKVVLIAEEVSPIVLHQLLRGGAADFVPYPLPEGALHEAVDRLRTPPPAPELAAMPVEPAIKSDGDRDGVVLPVHGLVGGAGATTFAVNLAWELAVLGYDKTPRVCLLDFDFQFGATATYLDLERKESVNELLSDTESMDSSSFLASLQTFEEKLAVLTTPSEMVPLEFVTPEDIARLLDVATSNFDFVIIDMPTTLVSWSETVLHEAQIYFTLLELDMRSAQNTLRFVRALKGEDLPYEKLRFAMNRAPKGLDMGGKARLKKMAESLDIDIELQLPDGQKQVTQAGDHGAPLAQSAPKNPLRKEILKLAKSLHEIARAEEAEA